MKRILISGIIIGLLVTFGAVAAILYATGYRIDLGGNGSGAIKFIEGTGLLVATSRPDGSRVLVNDHLTTATNNTINLPPGLYDIKIQKDGYVTWKKKIIIKKSLVSEASALLIPSAPKLEAVTTIGVSNAVMDLSQTLLGYTVASSSAQKNGIYFLDMGSRPLIFLSDTGTQLVSDVTDSFSEAQLSFSPDAKQILARLPNGTYYLLDARDADQTPQDVTNTLLGVERDWADRARLRDKKLIDSLPNNLVKLAQTYFSNMVPSPSGDKILYTASASGTLESVLKPTPPSLNSTPDERNIKKNNIYVYDIKEDKNYQTQSVGEDLESNKYFWHADSRHLIYAEGGRINIVEYDGENFTTVFNGPLLDSLVFPWPDGSSIAVVSRLSNTVPYNLYRISLQ